MAQKKAVYYSQKINGVETIDVRNQKIRADFIASQKDGCIEHTARRAVKPKTDKQRKTVFGHLIKNAIVQANDNGIDTTEFLKKMLDDTMGNGVALDSTFLYVFLLKYCPVFNEDHKPISLSKMSSEQAAKFFKDCQSSLAKAGIDIPDPNPNWNKDANQAQG